MQGHEALVAEVVRREAEVAHGAEAVRAHCASVEEHQLGREPVDGRLPGHEHLRALAQVHLEGVAHHGSVQQPSRNSENSVPCTIQ